MDPTTLITFLFQAPRDVRQVELLGSWDNFTQPYRMHHDRRRGTGFWSGCFKFDNIIFDGAEPQWSRPRSGGLKQGGVYWYYYRLDFDMEAYDDCLPHTADCPLMPGQVLNVVDVPVEIVEPVSRCRSASADIAGTLANVPMTHTLDPGAKFAALQPPPVSKVHGRSHSDFALGGRLESIPPSAGCSRATPPSRWPLSHDDAASLDSRPSKRRRSNSDGSEYSSDSPPSTSESHGRLSIIEAYTERPLGLEQWAMPAFSAPPSRLPPSPPAPASQSPDLDDYHAYDLGAFDNRSSSWRSNVSPHDDSNLDLDATTSCGPASVQNVQFYGSQIANNDDEEDASPSWLPRTHSVSHRRLQEHDPSSPRSPTVPGQGALDICSPTFSAATMSSNDGLNTPFRLSARLSAGYSRGATAYTSEEDPSFDEVAERLQSLDVEDDNDHPSPSIHEESPQHEYRSMFDQYVLPEPLPMNESVQSLGKFSFTKSSLALALPHFLQETTAVGSMADDIFSELGYLGGSIA